MSSPEQSTTAQTTENANEFIFTDYENKTHITFYPQAPGPIPSDPAKRGARLDYEGVEGKFTFLGDQVENQPGPLGSLITVVLKLRTDTGGLTFSLALPPVSMAGKKKQTFDTVAIKTKSIGFVLPEGATLFYTVANLRGVAEDVILPL